MEKIPPPTFSNSPTSSRASTRPRERAGLRPPRGSRRVRRTASPRSNPSPSPRGKARLPSSLGAAAAAAAGVPTGWADSPSRTSTPTSPPALTTRHRKALDELVGLESGCEMPEQSESEGEGGDGDDEVSGNESEMGVRGTQFTPGTGRRRRGRSGGTRWR